jgi:hypothetical protein
MTSSSLLAALLAVSVASAAPQRAKAPSQADVPPVSMTCPMHPDVVENSPGDCPICKMKLVPVRLETIWSCPAHTQVVEKLPGTCPIDHRPLVQMTVALTWTCADHPDINQVDRGVCADGKPMIPKRTLRPHGNHNPQHGGQFFMAPDNFHHLEGAYPAAGVFRVYLYDDYARPLPINQRKLVTARVVTNEQFDTATRTTKELAAFPLVWRGGRYLEARVSRAQLPAQMSAKVKFKGDAPEYRFDFTFPSYTKEPLAPVGGARVAAGASTPASATSSTAPPTPPEAAAPAGTTTVITQPPGDPLLVQLPAPTTVDETIAQLKTRSDQVGELIQRGDFTAVYVPAFQARDLAIALEARLNDLPPAKRGAAEPAISRLVRTAWLLDAFGDLGNRQQITDAYMVFTAAVAEVIDSFK